MKYVAYLCKEKEVRVPVPRHFLAPLALCEEVAVLREETVLEVLGREALERLLRRGETIVKDLDLIRRLGIDVKEPCYLRIVLSNVS